MNDPFLSEFTIIFNPDEFLVHPSADMAACELNTSTQQSVRSYISRRVDGGIQLMAGWRRSNRQTVG